MYTNLQIFEHISVPLFYLNWQYTVATSILEISK